MVYVPWPRLSPALMGTLAPDTVLSPLMNSRFDSLEAAAWLASLNYDGRLVVVVDRTLPDTQLVQREISAAGRGLRVEILVCI